MRLTKIHRDAFVRAVIADIPTTDYTEEARAIVLEDSITQLPKPLHAAARDPVCKPFLETTSTWLGFKSGMTVFAQRYGGFTPTSTAKKRIDALRAKYDEQNARLSEAESKVRGVIEACSTVRQAKERLPEFAKYLPEELEKSTNLPAIANVVADLTKLGWPKDKKAA